MLSNPIINVNNDLICVGGTATLTAQGANSYTWSPAGSLSSSSGSVVTASPSSSTNYTVTGSVGTCTGSRVSLVTVNAALTISPNAPVVCAGQSTTITATGANSYTWSPATDLSATTGATVVASPLVNTTYTIFAVSGVCSGSTIVNVTINPSATITVNSPTICAGTSTLLSALGASTYSWVASDGTILPNGTSASVSPTATTNYTVTSLNGCTSSNTTAVTVIANPTVTILTNSICAGNTATLTASGASSYTWNPSATISATTGSVVTATPSITANYTVKGSVGSCTSSATSTVVVTKVIISATSQSICPTASVNLTASGNASTYNWSPISTLSNGGVGASVVASPLVNTSYTVTGLIGTCSATLPVNVTIKNKPVVSVVSQSICSGVSAVLTATGASTYNWSNGATTSIISVSPITTTNYTVVGLLSGCSNSFVTTVSVTTTPTLILSPDITIIKGTSTTLTATGGTTFTWTPSTALSCINCAFPTANPVETTQYCNTSKNGVCSNTKCILVTVETPCYSNNDYSTPNAFSPNNDGINDEFCLQGWKDCITEFKISIYDRWGERVYESTDPSFCWDGTFKGNPLDAAVFVFQITAQDIKIGAVNKKGNITLLK